MTKESKQETPSGYAGQYGPVPSAGEGYGGAPWGPQPYGYPFPAGPAGYYGMPTGFPGAGPAVDVTVQTEVETSVAADAPAAPAPPPGPAAGQPYPPQYCMMYGLHHPYGPPPYMMYGPPMMYGPFPGMAPGQMPPAPQAGAAPEAVADTSATTAKADGSEYERDDCHDHERAYAAFMAAAHHHGAPFDHQAFAAQFGDDPRGLEHRFGQVMELYNDFVQGKTDPTKIMNFLSSSGAHFWKGAAVGAAIALLASNSTVKAAVADAFSTLFGCGKAGEQPSENKE